MGPDDPRRFDRRRFLAAGAADPVIPGPPFTLGVASGDPTPTAVVLWTRLAPDPLNGGGMPPDDVAVGWEVATDDGFTDVVASGTAVATAAHAHSVHVDAAGLAPATHYHYRFTAGGFTSPTGRTRTAPATGSSPSSMRFAFASCQSWTDGYYTAHAALAAEDVDVVHFLGDYIYEGGGSGVRSHGSPEVTTLAAYRNRYALYKGDANLQAAHAAFPWIVTWDDHEVENNYAGLVPQDPADAATFAARRAVAYQAWWEHQPVRLPAPTGPDLQIRRSFDWGDLARFAVLDGRQHRSDQACGDSLGQPCPEMDAPGRTMLGPEQEAWLDGVLRGSPAVWNVVANQTILAPMPLGPGINLDQWDGYPAAQQRLLDLFAAPGVTNPVVITGDIHASWITELPTSAKDRTSPTVGLELVGTSISSDFDDALAPIFEQLLTGLPGTHYVNARDRGYTVVELTRSQLTASYRVVSTVTAPEATVATATTFSWPVESAARPTPGPAGSTSGAPVTPAFTG
ncbi:MAG: alkaline phosphatase D family protein [Acidimicrobiales bacterium]